MTSPHRRSRRTLRTVVALTLTASVAGPLATAAAAGTAPTTTLAGTLVRAYVEAGPQRAARSAASELPGGPGSDQLTWVRTASGRQVRVPSTEVSTVPAGAQVRLTVGAARPGADNQPSAGRHVLATTVTTPAATTAPATGAATAAAATAGAATAGATRTAAAAGPAVQQITLVQAVPARSSSSAPAFAAGPTRIATLEAQVAKASTFWSTQTGGRVRLHVAKAVPWVRLSASCDDPDALWAQAARKAGWREAVGRHLVVQLPEAADVGGCGAGLGTVGRYLGDGGTTWTSYADWAVIAHELGHNFGLGHANALACGTVADRRSGCTEQAYEDGYDVMGVSWWNTGSLSTAHLDQLGLMSSATQRDVTRSPSATTSLAPVGGHRGVQSITFTDAGVRYWVEYRGPAGYDSWTTRNGYRDAHYNDGYTPGVLVRRTGPTRNPLSSYYDSRVLLRPRGVSASGSTRPQWTLTAGQSMMTAGGRTIRVTGVSGGRARVVVETSTPLTSLRSSVRASGRTVNGVSYHRSTSLTVTFATTPRMPRNGYRVLVDGVTRATAAATARSATATGLRSGRHTVAVRAVDAGRSITSPAATVLVDRTAPTFSTAPTVTLQRGAPVTAQVPLQLRFAAADPRLVRLASTSPKAVLPLASRGLAVSQRPGTTVSRAIVATDAAGNTSTATVRRLVRLGSEQWSTRYSAGWHPAAVPGALGGVVESSGVRSASATLTTTATDIGLVAPTGPTQGRITVLVDGRPGATVDLRSTRATGRGIVWTRHLVHRGTHTVRVVVQGTPGRPSVSLDGWVVLS